jgi:hypothetical protein
VFDVADERLLGSYLVRVSVGSAGRRLAVHSVLTGERRDCTDFAELAAYLDAATAAATRRPGLDERAGASVESTAGRGSTDDEPRDPEADGRRS